MCFEQCNECLGFKNGECLVYPSDSLISREALRFNFRCLKILILIYEIHYITLRGPNILLVLSSKTPYIIYRYSHFWRRLPLSFRKKQKLTKNIDEMPRGKHLHSWVRLTVLMSPFTRRPRPHLSCSATEKIKLLSSETLAYYSYQQKPNLDPLITNFHNHIKRKVYTTHTHTRPSKLVLWEHLRQAFLIIGTKYQSLHYLCQGKISRLVPQTLKKKAGIVLPFMSRMSLLEPHFAHSQGTSHIVRWNIRLIPTADKAFM
jgi:hypothetical protein